MIFGVTGSRTEPTREQKKYLSKFLSDIFRTGELHHGACVGVDEYSVLVAYPLGYNIVAHPAKGTNYKSDAAIAHSNQVLLSKPPLERNHDIVNACQGLIAVPSGTNEILRSGTWATIRFAEEIGRKIIFIWPDGTTSNDR